MRKKITLFMFLLLAGITTALAQNIPVKGTVVDAQGQPLPGVSVSVKGTQTGTLTDVSGAYTISAPSNGTLVFSFIGFDTQEKAVSGQTALNITLATANKSLDEVVVIGYGTQKKSVLTGAVTRVKASDLENQQVTRVDQALQGRTSGVTVVASSGAPGSAPTIRVRGVTSFRNNDPLYVIDGVVVLNGGLENVNPNDVESIEVLKDASAAIYGSRSSTGVVLVTTKKGKSGAPAVSYNTYLGTQRPVKKFDVLNAEQYATMRNQVAVNDGVATVPFPNPSQYGTGTNWQDLIFSNDAFIQSHNINVSGGTDKSNYFTSFGYLDQDGIVFPEISKFKKYNFTVNTSSKVAKWLTIGENFQYSYINSQNGFGTNTEFGGPLSSSINLDPITPILASADDIKGSPYTDKPVVRDAQGRPYAISKYVGQEMSNPLAYIETQRGNYGWSHNLQGNAFVEISPIDGLKLRTQINGKQAFWGSQSFTPLYYLTSQNNNASNPNGNRASNRNLTWNWENTASYTRKINQHNFTALIGASAQEQSEVGLSVQYNNLPITSYKDLSFNFNLPAENRIATSYEAQPYRVSSLFGRLTYDYDEKYLFTGIIRRDGSSRFGSNNVYGTFPSAEVGWVLTREDFFPKGDAINFMKLRGSYGVVGNEQSLDPFQYTSVVGGGRNYVFGTNVLTIGNAPLGPANADLKWETTKTLDIGVDAVLFQNFNVTIDYYNKRTSDLLIQYDLPFYGGYDQGLWANVGDLKNQGVELELGYTKRSGNLNWNVNGNISYNKNEVTKLGVTPYITPPNSNFQNSTYPLFRTDEGQPANSWFGFKQLGTFKSQAEIDAYVKDGNKIQPDAKPGDLKFQDTNGNGSIDEADRIFLGSQLPTWTYGLTANVAYKNFDLKIFGQGVWGNKLYQGYRRLDISTANYSTAVLDAWTPQNSGSNYPRLTDADPNNNYKRPSDFYLQSGAYFRIKTLQLGYTLPGALLTKINVKRARVYVSSNNLATFTKYDGFDPEIAGGIDRVIYPQARSILFGLDFTL